MWATFPCLGHQLGFLQTIFDPGIAAAAAISLIPTVEMLDVPADVPSAIVIGQRDYFIDRRTPVRDLFEPMVNQTIQSFGFILIRPNEI